MKRGCGKRKAGGIYACCPLGPGGMPVEYFLYCPPKVLNFDVPAVGQLPVKIDRVTHLIDWIGAEYYPNVADFIEEVRRFGLSRRISVKAEFSALTSESRLLTAHARAWIHDLDSYNSTDQRYWYCPKNPIEPPHKGMCLGAVYWDIHEGKEVDFLGFMSGTYAAETIRELLVQRDMPEFSYLGHTLLSYLNKAYSPAVFGGFPIHHFEVVMGQNGEGQAECEMLHGLDLSIPFKEVNE